MASAAFWLLFCCALVLTIVWAFMSRLLPRLQAFLGAVGVRKSKASIGQYEKELPTVTTLKKLDGPMALPLLGSMHKMAGDGGPFQAFTEMAKTYGEIYELQLGVSKCIIVSSYKLVKEVLITKGSHFGGRPDFLRFHQLFGGDRNNSLALCDWSDLQRKRRSIARSFCSPRGGSSQQEELSRVAVEETARLLDILSQQSNAPILKGESPLKPVILTAIANMFTVYMCSTHFGYADEQFNQVVRIFDQIFWDINEGYAVDFLPWLQMFYYRHLNRLNDWATYIRNFILKRIIEPRRASLDLENEVSRDFTDALLFHLESAESELSWQHIIFELEDFLGGHSAIGNLVMMILANAVSHPEVQTKIQAECDTILSQKYKNTGLISVNDRFDMPYTEAVIWETLRVASSPIVPHVATCDTDIGGYAVSKDTVVFLNNYDLNLGESCWGPDARDFRPERFLKEVEQDGVTATRVVRPEHFVPFSTGKRTCIGQRLVQGFGFVVVTGLLSRFNVSAPPNVNVKEKLKPSCVAVPPDCFHLVLTPRSSTSTMDAVL